jgi:hypothetical protein
LMRGRERRRWYVAHEILYYEPKRRSLGNRGRLTVEENLILIRARSPEEAYRKAVKRGGLNEEDVRIDGVEGRCKFAGLRDLVLVYDELEDGAELEWNRFEASGKDIRRIVKRKREMQAFAPAGPTTRPRTARPSPIPRAASPATPTTR